MLVFDFKVTTWERVEVPEKHEEEIKREIEAGRITTAQEIFDHLETDDISCDLMPDTSEPMSIEENDGQSTIEIIDLAQHDIIYTNADNLNK